MFFIVLPKNTVIAVVCGIIEDSDPLFILAAKFNGVWSKILQLVETDAAN